MSGFTFRVEAGLHAFRFICDLFIDSKYIAGTINIDKTAENIKPHTMDVATGAQINELPPKPVANENKPATVVNVVIYIGSIRLLAA